MSPMLLRTLSREMLACPLKMPSSPLVFMSPWMASGMHDQQHTSALTADGSMEFNMPMISGDDFSLGFTMLSFSLTT